MTIVLLLRAPAQGSPDKYETVFRESGYDAYSLPVLETSFTNSYALSRVVMLGPISQNLDGVIITSGRASEAWMNSVHSIPDDALDETVDWSTLPFYVVGKATSSALTEIASVPQHRHTLAPRDIRGQSTGTSKQLAHFICNDLSHRPARLLYLTGDKNRDELPTTLQSAGNELVSLQVYETRGSSTFAKSLAGLLETTFGKSDIWWLVYFAPSAADFVTPVLRDQFNIPSLDTELFTLCGRTTRIATIGPTTSAFLQNTLSIKVDITSPKPTPEDLMNAIKAFDATM